MEVCSLSLSLSLAFTDGVGGWTLVPHGRYGDDCNATTNRDLNCNISLGNLNYTPHPTPRVEGNTATAWPEKEDSGAAYTHALLWYVTQDERHAEKSVAIMDAWAATFRNQSDVTGKSAGLVAGWTGAVWPVESPLATDNVLERSLMDWGG